LTLRDIPVALRQVQGSRNVARHSRAAAFSSFRAMPLESRMLVAVRRAPRSPIAGLALALAAAVLASTPAFAQTAVRFSLDWRFEGPAAPFTVALDKGYFKAEGLDVTIEPAAGSREAVTRVGAGAYDMGSATSTHWCASATRTPRQAPRR
jgi:hypothetical protein